MNFSVFLKNFTSDQIFTFLVLSCDFKNNLSLFIETSAESCNPPKPLSNLFQTFFIRKLLFKLSPQNHHNNIANSNLHKYFSIFSVSPFAKTFQMPSTKMFNVYNDNKTCINQMKAIFTWKHINFPQGALQTTKIINIQATSI